MYNYPMDPRQHPDEVRRAVKPPDAGTFGNKIQFMALRSLEDDYKKLLDLYTIKYGLGDIIWPSYPLIYRKDLPEIVQELKKRNLYLLISGDMFPDLALVATGRHLWFRRDRWIYSKVNWVIAGWEWIMVNRMAGMLEDLPVRWYRLAAAGNSNT